jgi:hypothetical protein
MRLHALHIFILRLRDFVFCSNYDIKNHLSQASGLFFINKKALLVWKTSNACFSVQPSADVVRTRAASPH